MNESLKNFLIAVALIAGYAGISFLLAPVLSYLFILAWMFLALLGTTLDLFFSIIFWWGGYEGGIGDMFLETVTIWEPLTTWIVFMVISGILFLIALTNNSFEGFGDLLNYRTPHYNKSMIGVEDKEIFYTLVNAESRKNKIRSLCIHASTYFTPTINRLRKQFKEGKMSREEVIEALRSDFKKWKEEFNLSDIESKVVWKSICKNLNLLPPGARQLQDTEKHKRRGTGTDLK